MTMSEAAETQVAVVVAEIYAALTKLRNAEELTDLVEAGSDDALDNILAEFGADIIVVKMQVHGLYLRARKLQLELFDGAA